jgi:hypothetical protein
MRAGAEQLALESVTTERCENGWKVHGRIVEKPPLYELDVDLALKTRSDVRLENLRIEGGVAVFDIPSDSTPVTLTVDPDFNIFRRLYPSEVPPSINSLKASPSVSMIGRATYFSAFFPTRPSKTGLRRFFCRSQKCMSKRWREK